MVLIEGIKNMSKVCNMAALASNIVSEDVLCDLYRVVEILNYFATFKNKKNSLKIQNSCFSWKKIKKILGLHGKIHCHNPYYSMLQYLFKLPDWSLCAFKYNI